MMNLYVIGSGCPAPNPDQYGSAFILETDEFSAMIDCGPATTYKMAKMGLDPRDIGYLFFTRRLPPHFNR